MVVPGDTLIASEVAEERLFNPAYKCSFTEVFRAYQHVAGPLLAHCDAVMCSDSPFVMAEKYLIAAYVSRLTNCMYCQRIQEAAAVATGVEPGLVEKLAVDIDSSPLAPRLKPVFHLVRKLATDLHVTEEDRQYLIGLGWSKRAVFDLTAITGLFKNLIVLVDGMGLHDCPQLETTGTMLAKEGYKMVARMHDVSAPYAPPSAHEGVSHSRFSEQRAELLPGQRVTLVGLSKEQHNGKKGTVLEYVPHAGNWRVELNNAVVIRVAAENCVVENPLSAFVESSDEEYPPVSETPSSSQAPTTPTTAPQSDPECPVAKKASLASTRFIRVQERMAREYAPVPILEETKVSTRDKTETIYFRINAKWDKGRKALFAKAYTRLYKDGQRKLRVMLLDKDEPMTEDFED
eukprot:TRINITY_DN568_c0_g1_i5.p1 TRINITY_DN568_c0_g1~~TRINITY_DN568_c0_g1_i5.p1  ORF type:complete len:427 (+),score=103.57 TRINITY_DN568_c0_g1_i5:70-1281(+)